ncbi:MAG: hypothetical protein MZW92_27355 [Comamonadaceae bacterium]|nr:hypothetical protein [Comamonadaceae bacterium]
MLADLTQRNFAVNLGWPDTEVIGYLTDVLVDFVHVERLYGIRDARGRRVEEVAEMLAEGDLLHRADSAGARAHGPQAHRGTTRCSWRACFPSSSGVSGPRRS